MKRPFVWRLCLYGGIVVAFLAYYPFSAGGRQARNMRLAEHSMPKVKAMIAQDIRFTGVRGFSVGTWDGGCLALRGEVASEGDLAALKQLVTTAFPNVRFSWLVRVRAATPGGTES